MSIKSDKWIRRMAKQHGMIEPFAGQERQSRRRPRSSATALSYGYDIRWRPSSRSSPTSTARSSTPRTSTRTASSTSTADVCIIPPNSFALARTVEYFRIPRNVLTICVGKSTYARCGIIINVTPFEPEWEGHVTLEISNTTPLPARIYANEGCRCCSSRATRSARPATRTGAASTRGSGRHPAQDVNPSVGHDARNAVLGQETA